MFFDRINPLCFIVTIQLIYWRNNLYFLSITSQLYNNPKLITLSKTQESFRKNINLIFYLHKTDIIMNFFYISKILYSRKSNTSCYLKNQSSNAIKLYDILCFSFQNYMFIKNLYKSIDFIFLLLHVTIFTLKTQVQNHKLLIIPKSLKTPKPIEHLVIIFNRWMLIYLIQSYFISIIFLILI